MIEEPTVFQVAGAAALITFLATFAAGCLPLWKGIRTNHHLLRVLTRFAAGFLIASAFIVAIPEGIDMTISADHERSIRPTSESQAGTDAARQEGAHAGSSLTAGMALLLGFALMLVFESLGFGHAIHEEHHDEAGPHLHHPDDHGHRTHGLAKLVSLGLSVHALADGLAIGAAFASGSQILTVSLLLAMIMHKVPAAFSLAAFSQHTRADPRQTVRDVVLFSLATPLAMLVAWQALAGLKTSWLGHVLLFSAGTFLYVATVDVLPHIIADHDRKRVAIHVLTGALLLTLVIVAAKFLGLLSDVHG